MPLGGARIQYESASPRCRLLGGSLGVAALSASVEDMLHATGLRRHLDVFPTVEAAAARVTGLRVLSVIRRPAVA